MGTDQFFARHPVFTREEFVASRDGAAGSTGRAPNALLAYHVKRGNLLRVRRGLYAVVPPGSDPDSLPLDGYLLASRMADDAVLGYHTALELHGVAYSSSRRLPYLTQRHARPLLFRSMEFRPVLVPKPLRDERAERFGVALADRAGLEVALTTLERTLVDCLDRTDLAGGWEEAWRSLEAAGFYDLDQVIEYALLLGNRTTIAKVGFFLEEHREQFAVYDEDLARLRQHAPSAPHYIRRHRDESVTLVPGWNLVLPIAVARRSWGEVP